MLSFLIALSAAQLFQQPLPTLRAAPGQLLTPVSQVPVQVVSSAPPRPVPRTSDSSFPWALCAVVPLAAFAAGVRPSRPQNRFGQVSMLVDEGKELAATDEDFQAYWRAHKDKWATPFRLMDVTVAYQCGELNSILPSGQAARVPSDEPLLTVGRAVELHEKGEVQVRRRFRNLTPRELEERWDRAMVTCARLQMTGRWNDIVQESEVARQYEASRARGETDTSQASSAASRIVMTVQAPAQKATADVQNSLDGGMRLAMAELLETAGDTAEERLVTAILLSEFKNEVDSMAFEARLQAAEKMFAAKQARAQAQPQARSRRFTLGGVASAKILAGLALLYGLAVAAGNVFDDSLQTTLDLMQ